MQDPTGEPTSYPTDAPTAKPSVHPSVAPTTSPTYKPSSFPTSVPTSPSSAPTQHPTTKAEFKVKNTSAPTAAPTEVGEGAGALSQNSASEADSSKVGAIVGSAMAVLFLCCCFGLCFIYRQKKQKKEEEEMTPYEKWMRAEEDKDRRDTANDQTFSGRNPMQDSGGGRRPSRVQMGSERALPPPETDMQMDEAQGPSSIHNPLGYYGDGDGGELHEEFDQYGENGFDDDFSHENPNARRGSQSPGARRPSAARNPLRPGGGAVGRRGSAMAGGRPTSDAAAAFMARKKRHSSAR